MTDQAIVMVTDADMKGNTFPPTSYSNHSIGGNIVLSWGSGSDDESTSLNYFFRVGTTSGVDDVVETEISPDKNIKHLSVQPGMPRIKQSIS